MEVENEDNRDCFGNRELERHGKNSLMTIEDYFKYLDLDKFDSRKDVAEAMLELGKTLSDEKAWSEHYFVANVTVFARFCMDDGQLARFLGGFYNSTDQQVLFDKSMCSRECLDKLSELGMDIKGRVSIAVCLIPEWIQFLNRGRHIII